MNERVEDYVPRACKYRVSDIVRVLVRPENPCEVLVCGRLSSGWILFLMDKRTLKGEFRYDDDDQIELVRRPDTNKGTKADGARRNGMGAVSTEVSGRRAVHSERGDKVRPRFG